MLDNLQTFYLLRLSRLSYFKRDLLRKTFVITLYHLQIIYLQKKIKVSVLKVQLLMVVKLIINGSILEISKIFDRIIELTSDYCNVYGQSFARKLFILKIKRQPI